MKSLKRHLCRWWSRVGSFLLGKDASVLPKIFFQLFASRVFFTKNNIKMIKICKKLDAGYPESNEDS